MRYLWDQFTDPTDAVAPYTPYEFHPITMSMNRDFGRRESVAVIPGVDSVLDGYGKIPGPMDRRDLSFSFRVFTNGDNDAAYDLLAAQVAPGYPQRLVYQTDSGALWFTVGFNPHIQMTEASANNWRIGGYCDFTVTWRIRPDWRPRYSEAEPTRFLADNAAVFAADNSEIFTAPGSTHVTANPQPFVMDATGTAGADLPTIPDTGVFFQFIGPLGGDGGFTVTNGTATDPDTNGTARPVAFTVPFKLPTAGDSCSLAFASQTFLHNGVPFRPIKPKYQRHYFRTKPGIVNNCVVTALGANVVTGGYLTRVWWRKRA